MQEDRTCFTDVLDLRLALVLFAALFLSTAAGTMVIKPTKHRRRKDFLIGWWWWGGGGGARFQNFILKCYIIRPTLNHGNLTVMHSKWTSQLTIHAAGSNIPFKMSLLLSNSHYSNLFLNNLGGGG